LFTDQSFKIIQVTEAPNILNFITRWWWVGLFILYSPLLSGKELTADSVG